jgi:hypothetical protein
MLPSSDREELVLDATEEQIESSRGFIAHERAARRARSAPTGAFAGAPPLLEQPAQEIHRRREHDG